MAYLFVILSFYPDWGEALASRRQALMLYDGGLPALVDRFHTSASLSAMRMSSLFVLARKREPCAQPPPASLDTHLSHRTLALHAGVTIPPIEHPLHSIPHAQALKLSLTIVAPCRPPCLQIELHLLQARQSPTLRHFPPSQRIL